MNYSFDIEISKELGVDEAIMIENFRFWIAHNKANGTHNKHGHTWTYNSIDAFVKLFPFWTDKQIRRILDNLFHAGILIKGQHSDRKTDKTMWYAFKDEDKMLVKYASAQTGTSIPTKRAHVIRPNGHISITDIKLPDNLNTDTFRIAIMKWLEYKEKRKESYKDIVSIDILLKRLSKFSEQWIVARIDEAIMNQWKGLIFSNDKPEAEPQPTATYQGQGGKPDPDYKEADPTELYEQIKKAVKQ